MQPRAAVRYKLAAPVLLSWRTPRGEPVQQEGATRDISAAGAFILAAVCPPTDVAVRVEIFLPLRAPVGNTLKLTAEGRVVRQCVGQGQNGFVVLSKGFDIPELAYIR